MNAIYQGFTRAEANLFSTLMPRSCSCLGCGALVMHAGPGCHGLLDANKRERLLLRATLGHGQVERQGVGANAGGPHTCLYESEGGAR